MSKDKAAAVKEVVIVGCDDGHDSIKAEICVLRMQNDVVVGMERKQINIPSKVVRGVQATSLDGGVGSGVYRIGEQTYTVTDSLGDNVIDTRGMDYATSDVNRVLVNHALLRAGLGGREVRLVTGLPVSDFFRDSMPNMARIEAKKANLQGEGKSLASYPNPVEMPIIVDQSVCSEGVAAIMDMAIMDDGQDSKDFFALLSQQPMGVLDFGGKTVDMAVVHLDNGNPIVDMQRSSSFSFGMLRVLDALKRELNNRYELENVSPRVLQAALGSKKIMIAGEDVDISEAITAAVSRTWPDIFAQIQSSWGKAQNLGKIVAVGGGAYTLHPELNREYRHASTTEAPEYANARGMLKMGIRKYLLSVAAAAKAKADSAVAVAGK